MENLIRYILAIAILLACMGYLSFCWKPDAWFLHVPFAVTSLVLGSYGFWLAMKG